MANSLSNLIGDHAQGIHKIKREYRHDNKKCETCGIEYKDCECRFEYTNIKDGLVKQICLCSS